MMVKVVVVVMMMILMTMAMMSECTVRNCENFKNCATVRRELKQTSN